MQFVNKTFLLPKNEENSTIMRENWREIFDIDYDMKENKMETKILTVKEQNTLLSFS